MNRSRFFTLSFIVTVLFLFLKIYQHNKIVTLMYAKQRIERMQEKLKKRKENLLVELYKAKDQRLIRKRASEQLRMQSFKPSQVMTVTLQDDLNHSIGGLNSRVDHANCFTVRL